MSKGNDKLETLINENNERVKKVQELTEQVEQCKAAIAALKEEHDFTRGQITMLQEITDTSETTAKVKEKAK